MTKKIYLEPLKSVLGRCISHYYLSMAASVYVETVLSKLPRQLFKDVLLGNHNRKQHKNKKFFTVDRTTFHGNKVLF